MDVVVTGAHGLVAGALIPRLRERGDHVLRLVRGAPEGADDIVWDPVAGTIDAARLEGVDAVVHLAGAGIGDKKWTPARKQVVLSSRTAPTGLLARTLASLDAKPATLVSGSAIGIYGSRGDDVLTEDSTLGDDFAAQVCRAWEEETEPAADAGVRVVRVRSGIVLAPKGGMLSRLLPPFRLGLGGRVGPGTQWFSWISLADEVGAILHALDTAGVSGAVNLTAPHPVTNQQFTDALGSAVHRPTVLPTPLFPLRAIYGGELVDTLLLASQRVAPEVLTASGYEFAHPTVDDALRVAVDGD